MKEWLVDTNLLLDVLGVDERFGPISKEFLAECAETGIWVINPIISDAKVRD